MKALGSAISSGDLSTAQSAFATVANDLKSTPSQAVSNAEAAVNQTVQWMDDLLSLSSASSAPTTPVDPTTSILDAAYGQNAGTNGTGTSSTSSASTDPTTSILNSVYGDGTAGSSGTSAASGNTAAAASSAEPFSQWQRRQRSKRERLRVTSAGCRVSGIECRVSEPEPAPQLRQFADPDVAEGERLALIAVGLELDGG
jgi:hypothetical protein